MAFADYGVGLPINEPNLPLHHGWTLRNIYSAKDITSTSMTATLQFGFLPRR